MKQSQVSLDGVRPPAVAFGTWRYCASLLDQATAPRDVRSVPSSRTRNSARNSTLPPCDKLSRPGLWMRARSPKITPVFVFLERL